MHEKQYTAKQAVRAVLDKVSKLIKSSKAVNVPAQSAQVIELKQEFENLTSLLKGEAELKKAWTAEKGLKQHGELQRKRGESYGHEAPGTHSPSYSSGKDKGQSMVGDVLRHAPSHKKQQAIATAKDMHADKIMENRLLPSPKLKSEEAGEDRDQTIRRLQKSGLSPNQIESELAKAEMGKITKPLGIPPLKPGQDADPLKDDKKAIAKLPKLGKSELYNDLENLEQILKGEGYKPQNSKKENSKPSEHESKDADQHAEGKGPKGEIKPSEKEQAPPDGTQPQISPDKNPKEQAEGNNELAGTTPTQVGQDGKNKPGYDEMKGHLKLAKFLGMMEGKRLAKSKVSPASTGMPAQTGVKLPQ